MRAAGQAPQERAMPKFLPALTSAPEVRAVEGIRTRSRHASTTGISKVWGTSRSSRGSKGQKARPSALARRNLHRFALAP